MTQSPGELGDYFETATNGALQINRALAALLSSAELRHIGVILDPTVLGHDKIQDSFVRLQETLAATAMLAYHSASKMAELSGVPLWEEVVPIAFNGQTALASEEHIAVPEKPDTGPPLKDGSLEYLYTGVDLSIMAETPPVDPADAIVVQIVRDDTLMLNGRIVQLGKNELFILNAFLRLRNQISKATNLREGFANANALFSHSLVKLMVKLEHLSNGTEIVIKIGRKGGTTYRFNKNVVFEDRRGEDLSLTELSHVKKKP